MDVSVIMINYNTFQLTKDALESIFEYTKDLQYEIILVDNCSPDGSGEQLRKSFGDKIKYIQSGGNLGTSKAFNMGLKKASGRYILWLNTDILIKDNFIKKLFDYMEGNPGCGVCGGNVLDFNGNPAGSCRKKFTTLGEVKRQYSILHNLSERFSRKRHDYNYTGKPLRVAWVGGMDMMTRRQVFEEIGGFDEVIFMYAEEMEFQYRMTQMTDYTVMSVPEAHIYHLDGATTKKIKKAFNEQWEQLVFKGLPRYFYRWFGKEYVYKYLKIRRRGAKKLLAMAKLTGNAARKERCIKQLEMYNGYLNNFDAFISGLKDEKTATAVSANNE